MKILQHTTLREILDQDPSHPIAKAITSWINDKLHRSIDDVIDAWISFKEMEETYQGRRISRVWLEVDISVKFKDGFETRETLYVI